MGPTFFENAFSVLKFLKVIFSFILHPLILSMRYGSRRGPLPKNTSCHLIAKLRKVIIILGGPTGRSPGSPTGQSVPAPAACNKILSTITPKASYPKNFLASTFRIENSIYLCFSFVHSDIFFFSAVNFNMRFVDSYWSKREYQK